jgi:hypothetical protein
MPSESSTLIMLRFLAYTILVFLLTASLPFLIQHGDIDVFKEGGMIEWLQFGLLVTTSGVFIAAAVLVAPDRHLLLLLASLSAMAAMRETDALLDDLIPILGWKIGFVILLYPLGAVWTNRETFKQRMESLLSSRAFAMLWAGFVVAIPFSQMVGHGNFLQLLMGDDYQRDYKRVIEETGELVGYFLLLAGSFEALLERKTASGDLSGLNRGSGRRSETEAEPPRYAPSP